MTTKHFHNSTLNKHGVDVVTDNGERFGIACPDERTARTLAAGALLEQIRADVMKLAKERDPDQLGTWGAIFNEANKILPV